MRRNCRYRSGAVSGWATRAICQMNLPIAPRGCETTVIKKAGCFFTAACVWVRPTALWGCPLCESATGEQVREGIFNADFGSHLLAILLPFPVLVGIVALIYFGLPPWRKSEPQRAEPRTAESVSELRNEDL